MVIGMSDVEYSRWRATDCCKVCGEALSKHCVVYSNGCCPHCGACSAGTVVETVKRVYRWVSTPTGNPWWKFWAADYKSYREWK